MDIVIPLGSGSKWENNELRFSLRAIERNCKNVRNIYIIGDRPEFLSDQAIHIPCPDGQTKETNIMQKILAACSIPEISEDFLFTNDDIFINAPLDIETIPTYMREIDLQEAAKRLKSGNYAAAVHNTVRALKANQRPTNHFDGHVPIIYNKTKFREAMGMYDWTAPYGYVIKSLYCNTLRIHGKVLTDVKIDAPLNTNQLLSEFQSPFVSIGDQAISPILKEFLLAFFPVRSRYEK